MSIVTGFFHEQQEGDNVENLRLSNLIPTTSEIYKKEAIYIISHVDHT